MQNIPEQFKLYANSPDLYDQCETIGEKFNLHIDQIGELDAEIRDILDGVSKPEDFLRAVKERLEVDEKTANNIIQEVNTQVFDFLRKKIQSQNLADDQSVSSLERVGGFEVEKPEVDTENGVTSADKASILAGVENPQPSVPVMQDSAPTHIHSVDAPTNLPTGTPTWSKGQESVPAQQVRSATSRPSPSAVTSIPKPVQKPVFSSTPVAPKNEQHTEPLVDFLLGNTTASPAQKVVSQPMQQKPVTTAPQQAPRKSVPDPYREAVQ